MNMKMITRRMIFVFALTVLLFGSTALESVADFITFTDRDEWLDHLRVTPSVETFESVTGDMRFGHRAIGDLTLSTNHRGYIDVRPYRSNELNGINGDVLVDASIRPSDQLTIGLPDEVTAFGFEYHRDDTGGGLSTLINRQFVTSIPRGRTGFIGIVNNTGDSFDTVVLDAVVRPAELAFDNVEWGMAVGQREFRPSPTNVAIDQAVNLGYDPLDGRAILSATGLEGLTTTVLESMSLRFDPAKAPATTGHFEQSTASKFFKITALGEAELVFEAGYLPVGLSINELANDIRYSGSILPRGDWADAPGGGPYAYLIPEPSSAVLAYIGVICLLSKRGTRREIDRIDVRRPPT